MLEKVLFRNWWVCCFAVGATLVYFYHVNFLDDQSLGWVQKQFDLIQQREEALAQKEDLLLRVNSQSDPAWVELTLMKGLGLVPEEQIKVFFSKEVH